MPKLAPQVIGIALSLAAVAVPAPGLGAQELELGVWGGRTWSNEVTTDITICNANGCGPSSSWPHYKRRDVAGGIDARLALHNRIALQAGFALVRKGFGPGPGPKGRRVDSRYLEADATVQVRVVSFSLAELWIGGGVAPAFLLRCQTSGTTVSGFEESDCEIPSVTGVRHGPAVERDFAWVRGALIRINTPVGVFRVQGNYVKGIVDIKPDERGITTNRSFVAAVGFSRSL